MPTDHALNKFRVENGGFVVWHTFSFSACMNTWADMNANTHPRPNSLVEDYEYKIYDRGLLNSAPLASMEYGPCPIVVMSRHEGFQWNEDLLVGPIIRQSSGYESRKSIDRQQREEQVLDTSNCTVTGNGSSRNRSSSRGTNDGGSNSFSISRDNSSISRGPTDDMLRTNTSTPAAAPRDQVVKIQLTSTDRDIYP